MFISVFNFINSLRTLSILLLNTWSNTESTCTILLPHRGQVQICFSLIVVCFLRTGVITKWLNIRDTEQYPHLKTKRTNCNIFCNTKKHPNCSQPQQTLFSNVTLSMVMVVRNWGMPTTTMRQTLPPCEQARVKAQYYSLSPLGK